LVRVTGGAPLQANVWEIERLRCSRCSEIHTAKREPERRNASRSQGYSKKSGSLT
jgi:hypothetical protein